MLKNLNVLFKDAFSQVSSLNNSEYTFSASFQQHLKNAFLIYDITFNEKTTIFTSREGQKQICPNQWIRLVEYGINYYEELINFKQCYVDIRTILLENKTYPSKDSIDTIIRKLRDKEINVVPKDIQDVIDDYFPSADQALLFKRFILDYSWWRGKKTIERRDFYVTALLNLYNVVHVDNGFLIKLTEGLSEYGVSDIFENAFIKSLNTNKTVNPLVNGKHNIIYFGAPGTGKSKALDMKREQFFKQENYERVTFYPNYSYGQFFGTYKPKKVIENGTSELSYEFVPGPLFRLLIKALLNKEENYLLVIEEINRANAAAVFGDIFQLLDRDEDGYSEYPIHLTEDALNYIYDNYPNLTLTNGELKLPSNFYIWSTMNNADQGVQPLDSAFKRRFDFEFIGINTNELLISSYMVSIPGIDSIVNWNVFRKTLNTFLLNNYRHIKEDKLIGPFFIKPKALQNTNFADIFKNKLLMYLVEDILKTADKSKLFVVNTYSELMELCSKNNTKIFTNEFYYLLDQEMDTYLNNLTADTNLNRITQEVLQLEEHED